MIDKVDHTAGRLPDSVPDAPTFEIVTTHSEKQQRAYDLLETIRV